MVAAGCGEEADESNNGSSDNNGNMMDTGMDPDTDNCEVPAPADFEYAAGYDMRFTDIDFDTGTPISSLNGLLGTEFEDQAQALPPVVLFKLKELDTDAGTVQVRGGAGLKVDQTCDPETSEVGECEYEWDPEQPSQFYDASFDADTGQLTGTLEEFIFVATFEVGDSGDFEKATIRIENLQFDATLAPTCGDGVEIVEGDLAGRITEEDAENVQIRLTAEGDPLVLSTFIERNHELDLDTDDDGTNDAWQLDATFDAKQGTIVE